MDAYEATRIVYSRIQGVEPENAAKIMGLLLIQDHGEKEMIRLAFGPEALVHSVVLKARKELGLLPPTPAAAPASPNPFSRQSSGSNSSSRLGGTGGGSGLPSPSSWAAPSPFSRDDAADDHCYAAGDLMDELQLQEQLSFLNDGVPVVPKSDLFFPDECRSPGADAALFPYAGVNWGGHHRRSCSLADLYLGSDAAGGGFGWKPCLYYARGFCKNGCSCRFQHGLPDDQAAAAAMAGSKMDAMVEQQCHELLLRSKSQRLAGASQLMGSPTAFPYASPAPSPTGGKCMSFLLQQQQQQQQSESQRAAAAAAAAAFMLDEPHKFMGRSRLDRIDYAAMANPGSRQIYLTFPADSTFREEDVSNYFSIYGPVQDVRIPYQQKRMFGFVTFVYPETVKLILAKGNPHFVCDARVLVKPYKEKGKLPDKKHQQQQQLDRGDFSGCSTPTGMDSRDPYDLQQLGARFLFNNSQEALLRRKLEEQQQAAELQQAIELQSRRFMGLQLLDLKSRGLSLPMTSLPNPSPISTPTAVTTTPSTAITSSPTADDQPPDDKCSSPVDGEAKVAAVNPAPPAPADGEEPAAEKGGSSSNQDSEFQESMEHNLPDSPFASPIKSSCFHEAAAADVAVAAPGPLHSGGRLLPSSPALETAPFTSCFLQMPRFSPGHGAVGM